MATTADVLTVLKFVCSKQKLEYIPFNKFIDYVYNYAGHHVAENPNLAVYCGSDYKEALKKEIDSLVSARQVAIGDVQGEDCIFVTAVFVRRFAERYSQIEKDITIPFPTPYDLPRAMPASLVTKVKAEDFFNDYFKRADEEPAGKETLNDKTLYSVLFSEELPEMLFPSLYPVKSLLDIAERKFQSFLQAKGAYDYFLKCLVGAAPQKEVAIKAFFDSVCRDVGGSLENLKTSADSFYYWSNLIYYIRQDFLKLKSLNAGDSAVLQAVSTVEQVAKCYNTKQTHGNKAQAALNDIEAAMKNPPYYYTLSDILTMKDADGDAVLESCTEEQITAYIKSRINDSPDGKLPEILVFKPTGNAQHLCYIRKECVVPLVDYTATSVRSRIKKSMTDAWYKSLSKYEELPEMYDDAIFESKVREEVRGKVGVLDAILNAGFFLPLMSELPRDVASRYMRGKSGSSGNRSARKSLSEILLLTRSGILTDANERLPMWHHVIAFFRRLFRIGAKDAAAGKNGKSQSSASGVSDSSGRAGLSSAAGTLLEEIVPAGSTLDVELAAAERGWNDRIGQQNYRNLSDDVNSLIRDYVRKVRGTLRADTLDAGRLESLANALVNSNELSEIRNRAALKRYIELSILKIIQHS